MVEVGVEGKRFATKEELLALKEQLIACQPKEISLPVLNPELIYRWSDILEFMQVPDLYVRAHMDFYKKLDSNTKSW